MPSDQDSLPTLANKRFPLAFSCNWQFARTLGYFAGCAGESHRTLTDLAAEVGGGTQTTVATVAFGREGFIGMTDGRFI